MMTVIVYGICGEDGKIRYVGQTRGQMKGRWAGHKSMARRKRTTPLSKWMWREMKAKRQLKLFIIETDAIWHETEKRLIAWYRQNGARLLNLTDGGEGTLGFRHSGRKRPDLAARNKANRGKPTGRKPSPDNIRKMQEALQKLWPPIWTIERNRSRKGKPGWKPTAEQRKKKSEILKKVWENRPREVSEEVRAKLSTSQKLAWAEGRRDRKAARDRMIARAVARKNKNAA